MATIPEALAIAIQHHQAGRLQAAEQIYRQILAVEPNHVDALHLLGLLAHHVGRHDVAVEHIGRAIALKGNVAAFHNNLGEAYRALQRIPQAVACYRRAADLQPDFAEPHYRLGNALREQGKLEEAAASYRRAVELKPDYAEAHNNLGVTFKDQGKLEQAVACYRRTAQLRPSDVEPHNNLGGALKDQGKLDEAVACYRRALELAPRDAEVYNNLGVVLQEQKKLEEAAACYRRALELKPGYAEAHSNLGNVLRDQGKLDGAVACYHRAVALKPGYAEAYGNLGVAFTEQAKLEEAIACYHRALELKPDYAEAHNNLGSALKDQGKLDGAAACYRRALERKPHYAAAHSNLGAAFQAQGKLEDAVVCCRRALELEPDFVDAYSNLGNVLRDQGKLDEALACYRRAVEMEPDCAAAYNNLGNALKDQGALAEAIACYRRALELEPELAVAHSNLVLTLQYCPGVTRSALAEAHADFDRRHAAPLTEKDEGGRMKDEGQGPVRPSSAAPLGTSSFHPCGADILHPSPQLRLGFVSPDLGRHPVGYFLVGVLENLSRDEHETICYSDRIVKDDLSHRLQAAATRWHDVRGTSDERLAEQIRADRIDVLFDLAGHTARNRLLVFARKPAAIQVTWAGYVGTTGLKAMDYLLADRYEIPAAAEADYCERVLRMPDGYVCYAPPDYAPPVSPLPALDHGQVTLGCFNNPAKITPQAVEVWARILHRLPEARLVLKYKGWSDGGTARRFAEMFAAQAVDPGRLEFLGGSPHAQLLAEYDRIDLALDPFPYNGGLTTCEALWMGVPVVTCPGETFASRHSLSHLSNVGLTETIARDLDEYVERVVSLAGDLPRLALLRAGLRQRMAASPLCDGKRFAANLTSILHGVWEQRRGRGR
jgi:predicted O-linked N-acetylglucosamine transferase (SPINDLY family)